jgi:adenylate kinase family enzyme
MRIHITGASGSGTSTLGRAVAAALAIPFVDADDYYWLPTEPPFQAKREPAERLALLQQAACDPPDVVLAGSILRWGSALENAFDLIVFLYLDADIRVERLRAREAAQLGHADPAFLAWAAQYDDGLQAGRSLARHRAWLAERSCPILELRGDLSVDDRLAAVLAATTKLMRPS